MVFLTESWFWRGTQSAIFYYASCTPWVEYKHGKKRKRDAVKARADRNDSAVYTQPGVVRQPLPFQTNEEWAQEIVEGPGPPKGWKKDQIWHKHHGRIKLENIKTRARAGTGTTSSSHTRSDWSVFGTPTSLTGPQMSRILTQNGGGIERNNEESGPRNTLTESGNVLGTVPSHDGTCDRDLSPGISSTAVGSQPSISPDPLPGFHTNASLNTETTGSKRSSFESATSSERKPASRRPSMEKRLSYAMDGFKESMRVALHPEKWNWIRYDRDDEILPNLNEKMRSMWESMKVNVNALSEEAAARLRQIEPTEPVQESEASKWQRGTHPAINDLHPPIVSQLPYSREEAKWMLMPAPSADVMMGRRRPDPFTDTNRRPLCVMGRQERKDEVEKDVESYRVSPGGESASSEDEELRLHVQRPQRAHLVRHHQRSVSYYH